MYVVYIISSCMGRYCFHSFVNAFQLIMLRSMLIKLLRFPSVLTIIFSIPSCFSSLFTYSIFNHHVSMHLHLQLMIG